MVSKEEAKQALVNIFHFCEEIDNHLPDDEKTGYKMFPDYEKVRSYINESEKHGRWIQDYDGHMYSDVCSVCRGKSIFGARVYPYCPRCGAQMDTKAD